MNTSSDDLTNYTDVEENWDENLRKYELQSLILRTTADILTIVALLAMVSNIFVCSVILRYRRLRQNSAYKVIAGWLIVNTVFMLSSPLLLQTAFRVTDNLSKEAFCRFGQLNIIAFLGTVLFIVLLTFQWYFKFYHPSVSSKYDRTIVYYISALSALLVLFIVEGMVVCDYYFFLLAQINYLIVIFLFLAFIVFMTVLNIIHSCKKKMLNNGYDKNVAYILSNVFFFTHLSLLLVIFVSFLSGAETYMLIVLCVSFMITLICPLYFFFFLYKCDNKFRTLTNHVVSCRCTKYTGDELFDQPMYYEKQEVQQNEQV